jgi:H+/Cl- antiporter ClcA
MITSNSNRIETPWPNLAVVTVLTGIAAGLSGMLLALLLRLIQHVAFGYSMDSIAGHESFLEGVSASSPMRRLLVSALCGLVAGMGWWGLYRFGSRLVSIRDAVGKGTRLPALTTTVHDLLQIVTVALGSPLGREAAPREMGALFASFVSRRAGLTAETKRIMIACGAGAGLAAVYNVPLGGALFALEVLLGTFSVSAVIPAIVTSAIAAYVAWIGLGDETQYTLSHLAITPRLVVWSIIAGPVFGFAAYWFAEAVEMARTRAPRDWRLLAWCGLAFPAIGAMSIAFPQILGNGKGAAQLGFDSHLSVGLAGTLFLIRTAATIICVRAGAKGGILTPSVAIGAMLATMIGGLWNYIWPGTHPGAFAVVGATAFLASSMRMPLTAVVLVIELTGVDRDFVIPMVLAVAGSLSVCHLCKRRVRSQAAGGKRIAAEVQSVTEQVA